MPSIRKKTSKRGTTSKRASIKNKVRESHKKSKKAAKKNVQWKSRVKKDPGIPNSFPFKDQILAEVAENRRQAQEEKEKTKNAKKGVTKDEDTAMNGEEEGAVEGDVLGVTTLSGGPSAPAKRKAPALTPKSAPVEDDVPILIDPELPHLQAVLDKADIVIHILDARDPLAHRIPSLESSLLDKSKKVILLLHKIDLCPRESVSAWASHLRSQIPTFTFQSSTAFIPPDSPSIKGKQKASLDDGLGSDVLLEWLGSCATEKKDGDLAVAIVGLPNSGKSSIVNTLLRRAALSVYKPTANPQAQSQSTTTRPQAVVLDIGGRSVRIIDTPGITFASLPTIDELDAERTLARDVLIKCRGKIENIKDPVAAVAQILETAELEDLMIFYNLPAFQKGNVDAFLTSHARSTGRLNKGGIPDHKDSARSVLRDWRTAKFSRYTLPPSQSSPTTSAADATLSALYTKADSLILPTLQTRKEMRSTGLIRMKSGDVETRTPLLDAVAPIEDASSTAAGKQKVSKKRKVAIDVDESEEEAMSTDGEENDDEEGDEDEDMEDEDDEDDAPPPSSKRQKRVKPQSSSKKVSFDVPAKSAKAAQKPKSSGKPKPIAKAPAARKVGNAGMKKTEAAGTSGTETYDFGKFF